MHQADLIRSFDRTMIGAGFPSWWWAWLADRKACMLQSACGNDNSAAKVDQAAAHAPGSRGASRTGLAARDQIRRLPHARPDRRRATYCSRCRTRGSGRTNRPGKSSAPLRIRHAEDHHKNPGTFPSPESLVCFERSHGSVKRELTGASRLPARSGATRPPPVAKSQPGARPTTSSPLR